MLYETHGKSGGITSTTTTTAKRKKKKNLIELALYLSGKTMSAKFDAMSETANCSLMPESTSAFNMTKL